MELYKKTDPILTLKDVNLSYQGNKVLRDINVQVQNIERETTTGQVITLLGRSGVGKTQLIRLVGGLLQPTSGDILIGINQISSVPGKVGVVQQNYPLFNHYTLLENLKLVSKDLAKIEFYLNEFDIWDRKTAYPKQMSGGQRQRAAIIQQLLCPDHEFILLDEPFSGLDPVATDKLCENISKIVHLDEYNTVIISTHILSPAMAISDTIWMLGYDYRPEFVSAEQRTIYHKIPGAFIKHNYSLAEMGLAWRPDIRKDVQFQEFTEFIRELFKNL